MKFTRDMIGRRVEYTDRSGAKRRGSVRDLADGTHFVDVNLDGAMRPRNFLPDDTLRLLTEEELEAERIIDEA